MKEIPVKECINLGSIIRKYGLEQYTMVNMEIGYDDAVYLLFSARVPERIQGMFVDTQANTEYRALCLFIDWQDGSLLGEEVLEFGVRKMNFHFIQPIGDDILLLGARSMMYKNGIPDQNAVFLTRHGKILSSTCFGDGIQECMVLGDGSGISQEDNANFRGLGVSHILVVSGMHMAVLAAFLSGGERFEALEGVTVEVLPRWEGLRLTVHGVDVVVEWEPARSQDCQLLFTNQGESRVNSSLSVWQTDAIIEENALWPSGLVVPVEEGCLAVEIAPSGEIAARREG